MAAEEEEEGGVGNDACLLGKWVGRCGNEPILFRRILRKKRRVKINLRLPCLIVPWYGRDWRDIVLVTNPVSKKAIPVLKSLSLSTLGYNLGGWPDIHPDPFWSIWVFIQNCNVDLISQANIPGSFTFSSFMNPTTCGKNVEVLGPIIQKRDNQVFTSKEGVQGGSFWLITMG